MPISGVPFTEGNRRNINRVADGLLPLSNWLETKQFRPSGDWPWRTNAELTATDLGFDRFFEGLLIETSEDSDLKARWDWLEDSPLRLSPIPEVDSWRRIRGLSASPEFSPALSDNALVDVETRTVSRAEFYLPYWPLLSTAFESADRDAQAKGEQVDDVVFASKLLADKNEYWPGAGQVKSSRFCRQFVKDLLYCYLGLRNPVEEPWRHAVLIELGEQRRVGNQYTRQDCADAVERFNEVLENLRKVPEHAVTTGIERDFFNVPVGSPPINARDLT